MKRPYLVVRDYGKGGLWVYIWAESAEDIETRFDAQVVDEFPSWLANHRPGVVSLDIDAPRPEWLPLR